MASDRDTLAELIHPHQPAALGFWCSCGEALGCHIDQHRAEVVLDAGWRPPAREITDPAELDTLPIMSIVRAYGVAHQAVPSERAGALEWLKPAGQRTYTSAELLAACRGAGVTVLYEPVDEDEGADRG